MKAISQLVSLTSPFPYMFLEYTLLAPSITSAVTDFTQSKPNINTGKMPFSFLLLPFYQLPIHELLSI